MCRAMMRRAGKPERHGGHDELALAQRERLAAHDARHGEPADRADREEDEPQAAPEDDREDDDEEHVGQRVEHVHDAHHPAVHAPAEVARGRAPGHADHDAHGGGEQRHQQRHLRARPHAHEQVAAVAVGAEPVPVRERRRRGERAQRPVHLVHGVGARERPEQRGQHQHGNERGGRDRGPVASQPPPGVAPQRAVSHGGCAGRASHTARSTSRLSSRIRVA